jgi:hypothetical protein
LYIYFHCFITIFFIFYLHSLCFLVAHAFFFLGIPFIPSAQILYFIPFTLFPWFSLYFSPCIFLSSRLCRFLYFLSLSSFHSVIHFRLSLFLAHTCSSFSTLFSEK